MPPFFLSPRLERKIPARLEEAEVAALLDWPAETDSELRNRALLELLYATGVRCAELVGLDLEAVDLKERLVRVLGKGRKERIVPFGGRARAALEAYLLARLRFRPKAPALFVNRSVGRLTDRQVRRILNRRVLDVADGRPRIVAEAARDLHLAELPVLEELHRFPEALERAALRPGLADLVVLPGGLDDLAPFPDVVADRLLDVDVLAGLEAPDGQERMGVVRGGDRDRIDRLVLDQLPEVLDVSGLLPLLLLDGLHGLANDVLVHVADRGDLDALERQERLHVVHAPTAHAGHGDAKGVVGRGDRAGSERRRSGDEAGIGEKLTAREMCHEIRPRARTPPWSAFAAAIGRSTGVVTPVLPSGAEAA